MAYRAVVAAFHKLRTSAYYPYPVDTSAFVAGIERMERMDLVPAAAVEGIGLACVDPCHSLDVASAVLVVGGSLAVELLHLVGGEQQMIAGRNRVLHFSCLRRPLPLGQYQSRNQTTCSMWLEI